MSLSSTGAVRFLCLGLLVLWTPPFRDNEDELPIRDKKMKPDNVWSSDLLFSFLVLCKQLRSVRFRIRTVRENL